MLRFILLIIPFLLLANDPSLRNLPFEGDPTANVAGCVNAISGYFFLSEPDHVVPGAQPLPLMRQFTGREGDGWAFLPHIRMEEYNGEQSDYLAVSMPSGSIFHFNPKTSKSSCCEYKFSHEWGGEGLSNTSKGSISARFDPNLITITHDANRDLYVMRLPDGGKRVYESITNKKKYKRPYRLIREVLPNKNEIHFSYTDGHKLRKICTTSPSGVEYAAAHFRYEGDKEIITTSDGQTLEYVRKSAKKAPSHLLSVAKRYAPKEEINYGSERRYLTNRVKRIGLSDGRYLNIKTYSKGKNDVMWGKCVHLKYRHDARVGHIRSLNAPVGENGAEIPIYGFIYKLSSVGRDEGAWARGYTKVMDAEGNLQNIHFDQKKRLTKTETFHNGLRFSTSKLTWDGSQLMKKRLFDLRRLIFEQNYEYDNDGNLLSVTTQGPHDSPKTTRTKYTETHLPKKITYPSGLVKHLTYHEETDLFTSEILTYHGEVFKKVVYEYNSDNVLVTKTVNDRLITRITPWRGMPHIIEHCAIDPKTGEEQLIKREELTYNERYQVISTKVYDSQGVFFSETTSTFDPSGAIKAYTNELNETTTYKNNDHGLCLEERDPMGIVKSHEYDLACRRTCTHLPDRDLFFKYDTQSRLIGETDLSSNWTTYTYDALGNRDSIRHPDGTITSSLYSPLGFLIETRDPLGQKTSYVRDFDGNPLKITHPDGLSETFTYDDFGHLATHTNKEGHITTTQHDPLGRKTSVTYPDGSHEAWEYDLFNCLSHTDRHGNTTTYEYDAALHLIKEIGPETTTTYTYDTMGRCIEEVITAPNLPPRSLRKECDRLGRPVATYDSDGKETHITYDSHGNTLQLLTIENGEESLDTYTYDIYDRIISHIDPLGRETTTTYSDDYLNSDNRYVQKILTKEPSGCAIEIIHDVCGRPVQKETRDPLGCLIQKETFAYDAAGQQTTINTHIFPQESLHTTSITYDAMGRITSIDANGKVRRYSYSPEGSLIEFTKQNGTTLFTTFDAMGRPLSQRSSDETIHHTFTYTTFETPIIIDDHVNGTQTTRTLDPFGRIESETLASGHHLSCMWNAYGQRTSLTLPNKQTITYTHDAHFLRSITYGPFTHRYTHYRSEFCPKEEIPIIPSGPITRTYSPLSDLLTLKTPYSSERVVKDHKTQTIIQRERSLNTRQVHETFTYDALNQLIHDSDHTYSYDSNATRLTKNGVSEPLIETLISSARFDASDNLIHVTTPAGPITFTYDFLGRRMTKETPAGITTYIYDGLNEIGSYFNGSPSDLRILGHSLGAEIGGAILIEIAGRPYMPIHSITGDIVALVDTETEQIIDQTIYSPFGETTHHLPSWGFQSKRRDPETGWINFGRRTYAPKRGLFLTPDPKDYDLTANRHAYLNNNPLGHFDPYGMEEYHPADPYIHHLFNSHEDPTLENLIAVPRYELPDGLRAPERCFQEFHNDAHRETSFWNSPALHGSLHASGGAAEAIVGMQLALGTGGDLAPIGIAIAAHGADHFFTGLQTAATGESRDTATSQLLQKFGVPRYKANSFDNTLSVIGTFFGMAALRTTIVQNCVANRNLTLNQERSLFNSAAQRYDKNLTQLSHSFSKHTGRYPEKWGKVRGPMHTWHGQASKQLRIIYESPGKFKKVLDPKTGLTWIEKRLPDGRGVRLNQDYTFKGFID